MFRVSGNVSGLSEDSGSGGPIKVSINSGGKIGSKSKRSVQGLAAFIQHLRPLTQENPCFSVKILQISKK